MVDEETIRQQARQALDRVNIEDTDSAQVTRDIQAELWRFRQPRSKALYLEEALHFVQAAFDEHLPVCTHKDSCLLNKSFRSTLFFLQQELDTLPQIEHKGPSTPDYEQETFAAPTPTLANLHPTIQSAASSLFATGHYRQALLDAFIAVDNAVQAKSHLTHTGTQLMEVAFSANNPILKIGDSNNEQQGFMALFRGAMLAIRNPKAHSLGGTHDQQRALEWLSFASVLMRNLDEAVLQQPNQAAS
jgi:uncharacterized protein (TIGR02391 family)